MPAPSDLIHQTATTTGTGNFTLVAVNGKRTFNTGFGTGGTDLFDYYISSRDAAEWERGTGHLSDATTLVRDTVIASSNANAAVNFAAGTKDVTNDIPAAKQVTTDTTQTLTNKTLTSPVLTTPQINDTSADHQYVVAVSELAADRTVTLPLLTGNDEFVFKDHTQTLTNKTIDLTSNTLVGSVSEFNAALESADFYTSGGTDVALADGGTGASLTDPNADRILFWDDSAGAITWLTVSSGLDLTTTNLTSKLSTLQIFTTPGANTWNRPTGCRLVKVTVIGGGGAGGGAQAAASQVACGGGGGAGGGSIEWIDVTAISSETVTIGAAGTGVSGGTGGSGGTSSFGAHCSADGGTGAAQRITSGTSVTVSTAGGSGGAATGGTINNTGGAGSPCFRLSSTSGISSTGGDPPFGLGVGAFARVTQGNGNAAIADNYGAGGGGALSTSTTSYAGGDGYPGVVYVEEFY